MSPSSEYIRPAREALPPNSSQGSASQRGRRVMERRRRRRRVSTGTMADGSPLSPKFQKRRELFLWNSEHRAHLKRKAEARRAWVMARLRTADGPAYDELVKEAVAVFSEPPCCDDQLCAAIRAVSAIRGALWDGTATTEADESIWLTPAGWAATATGNGGAS